MSISQKLRAFAWKRDATWRDVIVLTAVIVLVIALIGIAR